MLNEKPKLTIEDFRRVLGDVYSIAGVTFTREVVKTLRPKLTPADEKLRATLDAFEKWDGRSTPNLRSRRWFRRCDWLFAPKS